MNIAAVILLAVLAGAMPGVRAEHESGHAPDTGLASGLEALSNGAMSALQSLNQDLGLSDGPEFLDPEVAFVVNARARDAQTVVAHWDIADGYYLYRRQFAFSAPDSPGSTLGEARFGEGRIKEDEFFGRVEVFYGEAEAVLPIRTAAGVSHLDLALRYQGCADAGLCYPPITKTIRVALSGQAPAPGPTGSAGAGPTGGGVTASDGTLSAQDRIARTLLSGSAWLVLAKFFVSGLLLAFTPCVLPMVPILSSIIVGQGPHITTGRAFVLSLTYVLAMALTYTVAGVVAGLSGTNLQIAFQEPWVLITFSGVFVLLALSMFGVYRLQVPASWQARLAEIGGRRRGGTYLGVGAMGFLSALIVGPCVAAPLAGALLYIASTGDPVLGGTALFALSMGMGVPVLAVCTPAGKLLPGAGPWMKLVQALFGVVLLGVAVYLLERIVPHWAAMMMWAGLFVFSAVYLLTSDALAVPSAGVSRLLGRGLGVVLMTYGVLLAAGAAIGGGNLARPLGGLARDGAVHRELAFKRVKGLEQLNRELDAAAASGKTVMLDFYADWCVSCKEMEKYTFTDPGVQTLLAGAVVLQTDVTANDERDQRMLRAFGLFGPPAILFFGPDGRERRQYRVEGFMNAARFRRHVGEATGTADRSA